MSAIFAAGAFACLAGFIAACQFMSLHHGYWLTITIPIALVFLAGFSFCAVAAFIPTKKGGK